MERIKTSSARRISHWGLGILTITLLLSTAAHHNFGALQSAQNNSPAPPAEVNGPIIEIEMASAIDPHGEIVNPTFTFPPSEPQITAIVYVGKVKGSQLKITWYKTSEDGDERLFQHQIQVKSYDRAFSVCKNATGTFALGTYKVVTVLEDQTEETEFDVSLPKTEPNKPSNRRGDKLFEDQVGCQGIDRDFSIRTNSSGSLTASAESAASQEPRIQKVAWNAFPQTTNATVGAVAGLSGTAPQPPNNPLGPSGCSLSFGGNVNSMRPPLTVVSEARCTAEKGVVPVTVFASVNGPPQFFGAYKAGTNETIFGIFQRDPCELGISDLPGTKIFVKATATSNGQELTSASQVKTLGNDTFGPLVHVVSTPARGSAVKAGDEISLHVTAKEQKSGESWQTGVWLIRVYVGDDFVKIWENPSKVPQPCYQKTWEQDLEATYTVPSNPPPTIEICADAFDYSIHYKAQCGQFYTIPEGKDNVMPANCKRKGFARLGFIDVSPLLGAFDSKNPNYQMDSCNFRWSICGTPYIKTKVSRLGKECSSFFTSAEASLPKEEYCCDCYPKCSAQRKPRE